MSRPKKMIQIEEEGSEEMDNESEDDTPRARRLTLNEFDWFEFENRARKLMGEMLEPIYQRQTDSRNDIKEIRKTLDSHKKRMDEQDFLMHKQAKRIDGVERIWEKLNTMERDRKNDEMKIASDLGSHKQEYLGTKHQVDRLAAAFRDQENKLEKQLAELSLAQNMILDVRTGIGEDVKNHLEKTSEMYSTLSNTLLSIQDRITEFDARAHVFKKQQDDIQGKIQYAEEEVKRTKALSVETHKMMNQKVEEDNYQHFSRMVKNDLKIMEENLKYKALVIQIDGEKRLAEVSEYLEKYFPIEVQKIVSDTLAKVLTKKRELVNLIQADREVFRDLRKHIVPETEEEKQLFERVEGALDAEEKKEQEPEVEVRVEEGKKEENAKNQEQATTEQKKQEQAEGREGAQSPKKEGEACPAERSRPPPVVVKLSKKQILMTQLLKEKRKETVGVMLQKINAEVDEDLQAALEKEEEEWDNIRKGVAVSSSSGESGGSSDEDDSDRDEDKTSGLKSSYAGSERRKKGGPGGAKQYSEDQDSAQREKAERKKSKKHHKKKKKRSKKEEDPFEGALLSENPSFFRQGRGSFAARQSNKKKKRGPSSRRLMNEDDRIEEDPESLRDSGSYTQALSKSSFRLQKEGQQNPTNLPPEDNASAMSKGLSSREASAKRTLRKMESKKEVSRTPVLEKEEIQEESKVSHVSSSRSPQPDIKTIAEEAGSKTRTIPPLSHKSSVRSIRQASVRRASRFTPALKSMEGTEPEDQDEDEQERQSIPHNLSVRSQSNRQMSQAIQGSHRDITAVVTEGSREDLESMEQASMEGSIESKPRAPIKVHDILDLGQPLHAGSYTSLLGHSHHSPVPIGINEEQLEEAIEERLKDYIREQEVQDRVEAVREELEQQFNEQMEEMEQNMGEHLKEQFKHLRDVTGSKLKETDMKFKTATDDMKFYVQNIENEVEGWLKKEKRTNNDKYGDLTHITAQVDKAAKNTESVLNALENVAAILACMVEHSSILASLISQDDQDKKNIALVGYRERLVNQSTNEALPALPSVANMSRKSFSPKMNKSYHTISPRSFLEESSGIISPDKNCLSCSGNKQVVMKAFKLACLAYAPGSVIYRGKQFPRDDLRAMATCITEACNDMINRQLPFTSKDISTKRYFDDMLIQIKINEKSMKQKIHSLDPNPSLDRFLTQIVNTSLPKQVKLTDSFQNHPRPEWELGELPFYQICLAHSQEEPKSLGGMPPPPLTTRSKVVKPVALGMTSLSKSVIHDSSNESLPLISPKRMASPRPS